jgi:hypothetical protein
MGDALLTEKSSKRINIVLIGSGGLGTIAALVLSKSGRARVTTVLRSKYDIIRSEGWLINSVDHGVVKGWRSERGEFYLFVLGNGRRSCFVPSWSNVYFFC